MVAVSAYCNYPPAAKTRPVIGGMTNPSLEKIMSMKPDMVILTDDGNPRETAERLGKLGIRTYAFRARRLDSLPGEIRALGTALGIPEQAERRAARIEKVIGEHRKKYAAAGRQDRKVLFVVQPDPLMVAGPRTAIDDVLNLLGLQNIAGRSPLSYAHFSLEEVIRQDPRIIFIGKSDAGMINQSRHLLKKLKDLDAVRCGRVYYIGDSLLRLGPRITDGITEMAGYVQKAGERK